MFAEPCAAGLEFARKLSAHIFLLPMMWRMCQRQLPGVTEVLLCFVDIWDQFRSSSLDFEARWVGGTSCRALLQGCRAGLEVGAEGVVWVVGK